MSEMFQSGFRLGECFVDPRAGEIRRPDGTSHVPPKALSRRERALLVDSFRAVRRFRSRLRTDLTGALC